MKGTPLSGPDEVDTAKIKRRQDDPRLDMHELNSAICMAIRKWMVLETKGRGMQRVIELERAASRPVVRAPSLQWFDTLLLKMREVRDTALKCGGLRRVVIDTGQPDDPVIAIEVDFTTQAMILTMPGKGKNKGKGGKVPGLTTGGLLDTTGKGGERRGKRLPQASTLSDKDKEDLLAQLDELNKRAREGDKEAKAQARNIRAQLRRAGVKGGARSNTKGAK